MIRRTLVLGYGFIAYVAFLASFTYAIGFVTGVGVPKGIDDGDLVPVWQAVLVNSGLLGLFAVQHSVMARPWFKRRWTRVVAPAVERSTYVLLASLILGLLMWQWRPITDVAWEVNGGLATTLLWVVQLGGWGLVVLSTFLIGHFDLFGLRQALARFRLAAYDEPGFRKPLLYGLVRHPIMAGFLVAFWVTPDMSAGRLLFATATTGYILIAVRFEEHDLRLQLGGPYEAYLAEVPRFVPRTAVQVTTTTPAEAD